MDNREFKELDETKKIENIDDFVIDSKDDDVIEELIPTKKGKSFWHKLSKKGKIIIIIVGMILIITIVSLILIFANKETKKPEKPSNVIPPKEEPVVIVKDNYKYKEGTLIFLDSEDKEIGEYTCNNKDENNCYVAYCSNEDNFDVTKNVYEDNEKLLLRSTIINNNYVFIYDNVEDSKVLKLYDITKKEISEDIYQSVKTFGEYAIVKNSLGKYGLLKLTTDGLVTVMKFNYDYLGFLNDKIVGFKSKKYVIYDLTGKSLSKNLSNEVKDLNDNYITTVDSNKNYILYNYKGEQKTTGEYDYIKLLDNFIVTINDKNMMLKDYEENNMMANTITLNTDQYNKVNVYDENNDLVSTNIAYSIEINNEIYTIYYTKDNVETTKVVNTLEGKLNTKYSFVNYFDNKLYFYDDEEKTNLIGEYTCTNKNVIDSESTEYNNCIIAKDENSASNDLDSITSKNGYLPIINKSYVFIKDIPQVVSDATMNIVLYDLVNKESKVKYRQIKSEFYNNTGITLIDTDATNIIAKNKNDLYGMIKITKTGVSGLVNFDYANIEAIGSNYQVKTVSNTYKVIDNKGKDLTTSFSGKIMNINSKYVTVLSNSSYKIYELNGTVFNSNEYKYIKLYNDYYITMSDDNKLNAYSNNKPEEKLFLTDLDLEVITGYKDGKSFISEIKDNMLHITIYKSDGNTNIHSASI